MIRPRHRRRVRATVADITTGILPFSEDIALP